MRPCSWHVVSDPVNFGLVFDNRSQLEHEIGSPFSVASLTLTVFSALIQCNVNVLFQYVPL